jgi:lia operon protein LiaG
MRTVLMVGVALSVVTRPSVAQTGQRYTVAGDNVAIYNLAGTVQVEAGSGSSVVVEVTRNGADAAKLQVATGPIRDRQTLRVIYPDDDIVYAPLGRHSNTSLDVRDDGTFNDDHGRFRGGHRVHISGDGSGIEAFADLRVQVPAGTRVALYLAVGRMTATNVHGDLRLDVNSADVQASGIQGSLTVDAGSGDVRVSDVTGSVNLDTGSGDVEAGRLQGDDLRIDTGSGDVTVDGAQGQTLKISTGSGNARATGVRAQDLKLDTGSGDVTLVLLEGGGSIYVDTGSGDVSLTLPTAYGADVVLDTGSGDIDLGGIPVTVHKIQRDHLEGRIGDGKGRLRVETGSGDVVLKKA